ncbi:hypothetical protein B0H13DRAFT_1911803 [Mycena leptocephala]|nr:hypothetical protein B0H13DRAFT_1911803 [Mycena leptocephala]
MAHPNSCHKSTTSKITLSTRSHSNTFKQTEHCRCHKSTTPHLFQIHLPCDYRWTEAELNLRFKSHPTILLGKKHPAGHNRGQESRRKLLGQYTPAVCGGGDYLGPKIINSLKLIHFFQGLVAQWLEHQMILLQWRVLFRKPGFNSLRDSSINPVIIPQVLSSPPPAWTLLSSTCSGTPTAICLPPAKLQSTYCVVCLRLVGPSCLPPTLELPPPFAWGSVSSLSPPPSSSSPLSTAGLSPTGFTPDLQLFN